MNKTALKIMFTTKSVVHFLHILFSVKSRLRAELFLMGLHKSIKQYVIMWKEKETNHSKHCYVNID